MENKILYSEPEGHVLSWRRRARIDLNFHVEMCCSDEGCVFKEPSASSREQAKCEDDLSGAGRFWGERRFGGEEGEVRKKCHVIGFRGVRA